MNFTFEGSVLKKNFKVTKLNLKIFQIIVYYEFFQRNLTYFKKVYQELQITSYYMVQNIAENAKKY